MAIEGPVRELAPSDLLQLLFLSRRTGVLKARNETINREVSLEVDGGWLTGATGNNLETRLGRLLVGSGKATDAQIDRALAVQRATPHRRLGEILVENRDVRRAEVERHLRFQVEEAVFDLMRWQEGVLRFEEGPSRPRTTIEIRLSTDSVLMESMRRLDEWTEVTAAAATPDPIPRLAPQEDGHPSPLSLRPQEWEVLTKVDGVTSLRRIALGLGRSELEVARAIYSLASVGVVEVGARAPAAAEEDRVSIDAEIEAIEAVFSSGDLVETERRIRALHLAHPDAPAVHLLRGRVLAAREDWPGAIAAYGRAVEIDPLFPAPYFHLALAAVRAGDLAAADRALATYRRLPDGSTERRRAAERMATGLRQLVGVIEEAGR